MLALLWNLGYLETAKLICESLGIVMPLQYIQYLNSRDRDRNYKKQRNKDKKYAIQKKSKIKKEIRRSIEKNWSKLHKKCYFKFNFEKKITPLDVQKMNDDKLKGWLSYFGLKSSGMKVKQL